MILIGTKILAEKIKTQNKSASGIFLGEAADLTAHRAIVLLTGPDVKHTKRGDVIKYNHNNVIEIDVEKKDCIFLDEVDSGLFKIGETTNE